MYDRDQQRCYKRIAKKSLDEQQRISEKYFKGKKPWIRRARI
jgi:hypothetical protein